jgi:predicted amidohydrolase
MNLKIALAQMDITFGNPQANLAKARQLIVRAAEQKADLILFPELWSTGYDLSNAARHATLLNEGIFAEIAELAKANRIYVLGSNLSVLAPEKFGNTLTAFTPDGTLAGHYSKTHLFGLMNEPKYLTAGDSLTLLDLPFAKSGLSICYDLRFPELFRAYALRGAEIVFVPAEWPNPRLAHWQTLLRARAIENQMYVAACNRVGSDPGNTFFGHSCVIDPWGEILVEGDDQESLLMTTIDMEKVAEVRRKIPVFNDRRPDVY